MRTIIHIGQHKTGTTSLQHYLKSDRNCLIRQGLYVPDSLAGFDDASHFMLNVYALSKIRMSPLKETFRATSEARMAELFTELEHDIERHYEQAKESACDSVLWTNEGLYLLNSIDEYTTLLKLFSKYSSTVLCICCFREVTSYRSSYQQQLINMGIKPSNDPDSYRYTQLDSWLFDYDRKTQLLESVFEEVLTFDYDPTDNVAAFLKATGYQDERASGHQRLNNSKP